jgi:hypothetical protein
MAFQVSWIGTLSETNKRTELTKVITHTKLNTARRVPPLGRELLLDGNILERHREVHEEEIELVEAPELELILGHLLDMLRSVVCVPEL